MTEKVDSKMVKLWLERLRINDIDSEEERAQAASELSRLHIRTRGSVRTRGSLRHPAQAEFPSELSRDAMRILLKALQDESLSVRREVVFALGEWGNEDAVTILHGVVIGDKQDPEEEVRRAAIAALGAIGGATAVKTLCQVAESNSSEAIRYSALATLTDLTQQEQSTSKVRTREAIATRTRGSAVRPRAGLEIEAQEVVATLRRIRDKEGEKEYIRRMSEAALAPLVE